MATTLTARVQRQRDFNHSWAYSSLSRITRILPWPFQRGHNLRLGIKLSGSFAMRTALSGVCVSMLFGRPGAWATIRDRFPVIDRLLMTRSTVSDPLW